MSGEKKTTPQQDNMEMVKTVAALEGFDYSYDNGQLECELFT